MRRKDLEVYGKEKIEPILRKCTVCRIAMIADGKPYIIPMVFGYRWDDEELNLYMHCGLRGRKNKALKENALVCFEMDIEGGLIGAGGPAIKHSRAFEAIIGEGRVIFAKNNEEKRAGFDVIMKHQTGKEGWVYPDAYLAAVEVFKIRADSFHASQKIDPHKT